MSNWLNNLRIAEGWFALFAVALPALVGLILWRHEKRRLSKTSELGPTCESCGYLLIGLTECRCPECGTPFAGDELDRPIAEARDRRR